MCVFACVTSFWDCGFEAKNMTHTLTLSLQSALLLLRTKRNLDEKVLELSSVSHVKVTKEKN